MDLKGSLATIDFFNQQLQYNKNSF